MSVFSKISLIFSLSFLLVGGGLWYLSGIYGIPPLAEDQAETRAATSSPLEVEAGFEAGESLVSSQEMGGLWGRLFPPVPQNLEVPPEEVVEEVVSVPEISRANWLAYITSVTDNSGEVFYFFKDGRNGRIYKLSSGKGDGSLLLSEELSDRFILQIQGDYFEVFR